MESTATGLSFDEVQQAVIRSLAKVLGSELSGATTQTRLFEDLALDSTSVLELLMAIEEELGVEFDPDTLEMQHFATIGSLSEYVHAAGQ